MTGIDRPPHQRGGGAPMGPPWPVDVLADLHAGVLEPQVAQQLWPRVRQDPDAVAVLEALDATRAELSGLAAAPPIPMPARFAARLDAAIAAEAAHRAPVQVAPPPPLAPQPPPMPVAPVIDLARARRRRNQRLGWAAGVLVAAAAVAVAVISIPKGGTTPGTNGTSSAAGPLALHSGQINGTTLAAAIGHTDYGPLSDPARRRACLAANNVDPSATPAGVLRVTLDGTPGVLFVLPTGQLAQYRLLVVGANCAAADPDHLAETVVGGLPVPPTR